MFIWKNISSARRDPGRIQARSLLAGEIFPHVNACEIYEVKLYEAGSRLSDFPDETGKCLGNFLRMNRPLNIWRPLIT